MELTIAEELMLLVLRERDGAKLIAGTELNTGVVGAVLAELAVAEKIDVQDERVHVLDPVPTGVDYVDAALARIAESKKPRKPDWWVGTLGWRDQTAEPLARLVESGAVTEEDRKVLKIFSVRRHLEADPSIEREVRERIERSLADAEPDARTAALIALMHACGLTKKTFPEADKRRVQEIIDGAWAGAAVKQAIQAVYAGAMAAMVAVTAGTTASS